VGCVNRSAHSIVPGLQLQEEERVNLDPLKI